MSGSSSRACSASSRARRSRSTPARCRRPGTRVRPSTRAMRARRNRQHQASRFRSRDRESKEHAQKTRHADLDLSDGKGALEGTRRASPLACTQRSTMTLSATPSTACNAAAVATLAAVPTTPIRAQADGLPGSVVAASATSATPRMRLPGIVQDDSPPRGNQPHTPRRLPRNHSDRCSSDAAALQRRA